MMDVESILAVWYEKYQPTEKDDYNLTLTTSEVFQGIHLHSPFSLLSEHELADKLDQFGYIFIVEDNEFLWLLCEK